MSPNPTDAASELQLTPEQALELEKARAENTTSRLELAKLEQRQREVEAEHAELLRGQAHRDAILEAGVKWYESALATKLTADFDVRVDAEGKASGLIDGKRVPLAKVYQAIAAKYPTLADGRSTRGLKETAEPAPKARSEMSKEEKISYLRTHTAEEFAALPAYPVRTVQVKTREDFLSLPIKQRMALQAEHGEAWLVKLPREPRRKF